MLLDENKVYYIYCFSKKVLCTEAILYRLVNIKKQKRKTGAGAFYRLKHAFTVSFTSVHKLNY